jgi:lysophospholipase L1-like esterase
MLDEPAAVARRPGRFLRIAGTVSPGVRRVHDQIAPYAAAWRAANADALEATGPLWVALGDSMTQGIGARSIWGGWVGQAVESLAADGPRYRVINLAVSGGRIRDVAGAQLDALERLGLAPDLVTILVGSNDLLLKSRRVNAVADFAALLARVPTGAVIATMPQPRQVAREINVLIEQAQTDGRVSIAEMRGRSIGSWKGSLADDHFHPNEVGYARLAAAFVKAIRTL